MTDSLLQDLRFAARMLARNRGFTLVAVLVLALGIGANATIFSIVDAVLFRPLPFEDPDRLVRVAIFKEAQRYVVPPTRRSLEEWRRHSESLEGLASLRFCHYVISNNNGTSGTYCDLVEPELFPVLGARPYLGRLFRSEDAQPGAEKVVVLGHGYWTSAFGADPGIVGESIRLRDVLRAADESFRVVGVLPRDFAAPGGENTFLLPWAPEGGPETRPGWVIARLSDGVSLAQAEAELNNTLADRGKDGQDRVILTTVHEELVKRARTGLLVAWGAVGFVLLIACVNLTVLLLQRATSRERELAIRSVLGAGRWRLVRQGLIESLLLGLVGGAAGLMFAHWGVKAAIALRPDNWRMPRIELAGIDASVLAFVTGITVVTVLLAGLLPALRLSRPSTQEALKQTGTSASRESSGVSGVLLVITEMGLALILLTGTGLVVRSFGKLVRFDPGFEVSDLQTVQVWSPPALVKDDARRSMVFGQIQARLASRPEVSLEAMSSALPHVSELSSVTAEGGGNTPAVYFQISPELFDALDITVMEGRGLNPSDQHVIPVPVVLSRKAAEDLWRDDNPLGRPVKFYYGRQIHDGVVVGVAEDIRLTGPLSSGMETALYYPYQAAPPVHMNYIFRSNLPSVRLGELLREEVHAIDPDAAVEAPLSLRQAYFKYFDEPRFYTSLFSAFGALALLLAVVGIFGVISYSVGRRTHEFGVRMALGAQRGNILRMVLRQGMTLVVVGAASGLTVSYWLTKYLKSFLYEVDPTDPLTFAAVTVLLSAVALAACWVPARRATRVDPMTALRYE